MMPNELPPPQETYIFHQNMLDFGGSQGRNRRNTAYARAFSQVSHLLSPHRILVAGFTEVKNCQTAAGALEELAPHLDGELGRTMLFYVGETAGGDHGSLPEWIGISIRNDFDLEICGKVLRVTDTAWQAFPAMGERSIPAESPPAGEYAVDVRGLAYVGGRWEGDRYLFGFMHNMHQTNIPTVIYTALPRMVDAIVAAHGQGWRLNTTYIGGDFNVAPRSVEGLEAVYARISGGRGPIPTTTKNCLDYWLTADETRCSLDAGVCPSTQGRGLSDHAGVALKIT